MPLTPDTAKPANETRRTDWVPYGHYGFAAYRIWMRRTEHGMFQRHEWKRDDGSIDLEDWIAAPWKDFGAHYAPVDEAA
jgi:hypothetical protein